MEEQNNVYKNDKQEHPYKKANVLSKIFFTWLFPLFYKGYYKDLTEEDIYPTLEQHDSTFLGDKLEKEWNKEYRSKNKEPSLWKAMIRGFGSELWGLAFVYMFQELIVKLSQPLILSQLLKYYEPGSTMSETEAYIYSGLIVLSAAVAIVSQHNFMLYQYVFGIKIRIASSALVYRKALKLSRSSLTETNLGQMVNLISNDVARFESAVKHIHSLWLTPLELLIILALLYFYVGPSGTAGVLFMMLFIPLQMWLGTKTSLFRYRTALKTDERISLMNEIISGIQVIKMYTWEKPFAKLVEISRRKEMQQIRKTSNIKSAVLSFHLFVNKIAVYLCVLVYVLTGNIVNAQYVYVVTSFYSVIHAVVTKRFPEGSTQIAEARISFGRIKKFLMREEMEPNFNTDFMNSDKQQPEFHVGNVEDIVQNRSKFPTQLVNIRNVSVKWNNSLNEYVLNSITMELFSKELAVGSGKTTILNTILRELPALSGKVEITGKISYASQEPWLFMGSIKQNIIFGQPFYQKKYDDVIKVCALERDLTLFSYGDKTLVGERGVTLSGGQKARINLARAVYKDADIYLLDDPLSAVDTHVGKHIYEECFQKYLQNKCVVLITHQLQYLKNSKKIFLIDNGKINFSGNYDEILKSDHEYAKLLIELTNKPNEEVSDENEESKKEKEGKEQTKIKEITKKRYDTDPKLAKESREIGNVSFQVYNQYLCSGGHWCKIFWISILFISGQLLNSISDYFLTWWVNAEDLRTRNQITNEQVIGNLNFTETGITSDSDNTSIDVFQENLISNNITSEEITAFQQLWLTYMTDDICLIVYTSLLLFLVILALCRSTCFFRFCISASTKLHNIMFGKIVYATMRFFNSNPSGRILNRFSNDMNQVDEALPASMMDTLQHGLTVLFTTIVVATVNPWMLIPTGLILVIFYFLRRIYMATSSDIKRLDGITRSPIYSYLAASLEGLTTIRAFGAQEVLSKEFDQHQNRNSSAFITFIALGRGFGLLLDAHCVIYIFLVTMSFLFFKTDTSGGFVGLSITQSLTLTGMFQLCIRQFSELENQMTAVERIKEYIDVVPESNDNVQDPPKDWPTKGKITFKNLSLRYDIDQPMILKNITFSISGNEKAGVVGRTGAGKSSIIIALFRLAENEGLIAIDGVDINTISRKKLRSNIAIIPQEPVLFTATLRKNLDPFDEYSDQVLWSALEEVELKEVVSELPHGLESGMLEGGSNFSIGQRQLVCLARAIIRNNKILIMDEATANVDPHTDALIQSTIRRKFSNCTVLTIAHRLHTIMDSDKVLVMDAGQVVEFGSPFELMQNSEGVFSEMVEQTGKAMAENLFSIAQKANQKIAAPPSR